MSSPIISQLPTILIKQQFDSNQDSKAKIRDAQIPTWHSWLEKFWFYVSFIIAHWYYIYYLSLDIYFRVMFTQTQQKPKGKSASSESGTSQNDFKDTIGQLALHPTLPLLVVCLSRSREIAFYNTRTCNKLQKFQIKLLEFVGKNGTTIKCNVTCLKFSTWSKLAIGLSDGTVRVVEQNLRAMLAAEGVDEDKRISFRKVKLLPCSSSDISFKFIGPVTNLVFPSRAEITAGGDSWLAITTENSGVWIWNEQTRQCVRVINTIGINQGCLHWISLSMKQSQIGKTIERNRPLNDFTHRKLGSIFGSSDNLAGLDEYYSSPPGNSTSSSLAKSPTPLPKPRTSSFSSTSETETLQELLYDAGSLLIFGTKDGNLQVNKIFHSSRVLQFITSVNVCPAAIAEPTGTFQSMSGLASGEITHLVMQSHHITEHSITLPIFAAFKGDNSSILHQFSVAVLRKKAVKSNLWKARNITEASLRSFVNLALSLRKAHYRWLPSTDSTEGSITNHTQHMAKLPPSLASPAVSGKAFLISACAQPGTDLIFTTLHLNLSSQCVILQPSATLNPTRVNPLFPVPTNLAEPLIPSPSGLRGHDADNPADAGLFTPASPSSPNRRLHEARVGMTCVHDFPCGGIAWGRSVRGGSMGAFLYTPASSVDNGVGVGMFEVRF